MNNVAETIKEQINIQQVLSRYGYETNRAGFINCPFHDEKTPSLRIYPDSNSFYCFGCNVGGDVIGFVMHLFHIDFSQAIVRIDNDFNIGLPTRKLSIREQYQAQQELKQRAVEQAKKQQLKFTYNLIYNAVSAKHRHLWIIYKTKCPKVADEPLNKEFVEALHNLDYLEWWLDNFNTFEKWQEVNVELDRN